MFVCMVNKKKKKKNLKEESAISESRVAHRSYMLFLSASFKAKMQKKNTFKVI